MPGSPLIHASRFWGKREGDRQTKRQGRQDRQDRQIDHHRSKPTKCDLHPTLKMWTPAIIAHLL